MKNIELQDFCSVDEARIAICTPFVFDGWKYATDGRICLRVKSDEPDDDNEPYKRPNASVLFAGFDVSKLEAFDIPELHGVEKVKCSRCNGLGYSTCNLGHNHDCDCDGGTNEKWPTKDIGSACFSERYLSKIKRLPSLKFFPTSANSAALFTFDNCQGLLMPMREREEAP